MHRKIFALATAIFLLSLALNIFAQSPDKILKQATKAHGGEKNFRAVKSWQVKGTIVRKGDGETGTYLAEATAPNLYRTVIDLRGLQTSNGFSGKSGWSRDSRNGLRTLTGFESRDFQAEALYRNTRWLDYKKEKSKIAAAGTAQIDGKTANTIIITTAKNVPLKLYFDATSGLLIREEFPAGDAKRVIDYKDYRAIDGVMEPHAMTVTNGAETLEITFTQITHNIALDRAAFDFPKISNEPLPDIQALLKAVKENEDKIDDLLEKYTYTEKLTKRELDSSGQLRVKDSKVYELTFYKGNRIRRLIENNGKPLSASETESENKRIEKRVRSLEKKEAEKEKKAEKERGVDQDTAGPPEEEGKRPSISDILRASKLTNPRREQFRGRAVIVFDFEPVPGYKPQKDYEKFFGKTAGAIWVDAADKQVARVEARLVEAYKVAGGMLASLKEGATFVLENDHINNEIWLPSRADINLSVKVLMIKGFTANSVVEFSNYKRFNVDAEKEKLKDPTAIEKKF